MSSRSVSVVLTAQVQNYLSNMRAAEQHTRDVERAARSATEQFRIHNEALTKIGTGMSIAGGAIAVGFGLAIKASAEYGAKMAQLQSLSHATSSQMRGLSDAAMTQGQAFGQSAAQVADAEIELTKAGRSAAQIMGGDLKGALALAAAGQLDVAKATQIGVTAVTQFGQSGATIPHVADLLAAGADKALGSVEDLGMALNQGGLVAAQMGVSVEETTGTLAAFAQSGLLGSDAGTSFKTMLLSLQSPSKQAAGYLKEYNIHAYDAEGHFVGMAGLAGQLKTGFQGVADSQRDAALSTIFGTDAIRAANVLYKEGATGIRGWTKDVNAQGFAAAQAAGKMNSLQGDVQKLSAAFQTDLIKAGTSGEGAFRGIVQSATNVVQAAGDIPAPLQTAGVAAGVLVGGVALLGGAFLIAVPKIAAFRHGLDELGVSGSRAAGMFGKGAGLVVGITAVASGIAAAGTHGIAGAEDMAKAADTITGKFQHLDAQFAKGDFFTGIDSAREALSQSYGQGSTDAGIAKAVDTWTGGITHLSDVWKANEATFNAFGQQLAAMSSSGNYRGATAGFNQYVAALGGGKDVLHELQSASKDYREEIINQLHENKIAVTEQNILNGEQGKGAVGARLLAAAQAKAAQSAAVQAEGVAKLAGKAAGATQDIGDLEKAIEGFGSAQLDARAATSAMEQAIADATKKIAGNKKGIDLHTQAGRDNDEMLRGIASSTTAAASKTLDLTKNTGAAADVMKEGRAGFLRAAAAAGIVGDKAQRLADKYGLIPKNITTAIHQTGADDAIRKADILAGRINNLDKTTATIYIDAVARGVTTGHAAQIAKNAYLNAQGNADGGAITGPGPKGVDSTLRMLAPGEHVLTAKDVDRMGGQGAVYDFRAALAASDVPGMANGGAVRRRGSDVHLALRTPKPKARKAAGFGGIVDQTKIAAHAATVQAEQQKRLDAARKRLAGQEKAAKAAETRAQKARDAAAKIYGKGSGPAKHAATMRARAASAAAKRATDAAKATQKTIDAATKARDAAKQDHADALAAAATLRQGSEDFVSAERRNPDRVSTDPLQYVDELRQMSRDGNFSKTRRKAMDDAANQYEADLVRLGKSSTDAAKKLDDLKQSSTQLHDSVKSAVSGGYTLGGAAQSQTAGGWVVRDGIRYQTTSSGPTAGSISAYFHQGRGTADAFAAALQQLAGRGLDVTLLAQLAGMGTEQGMPIAQALLSASPSELGSINSDVAGIGAAADRAGSTVADATYAEQIAAADRNAAEITAQIAADGAALRKLLARAFGLSGYAVGTDSAAPGLHLVGEQGPELIGFRGGEKVLRAPDTARWIRGASTGGGAGGNVVRLQVAMPTSLDLVDAGGGLISTVQAVARDVAVQEITADALHDAVLLAGGAA